MSKELTTTNNSVEMLNALRNTVAPGLTDAEFMLFAEICRSTGLNPATKELWAIKAGGRLQLMTGINGFLKIANSHPAFDGMEVSYEWDGKTLVSCTVKVHRKDRKFPAIATAFMAEYAKPTPIWKQMPSVMLAKCAKSLAIREAFIQELGGLYTAEEMPASFAAPIPQPPEGHEVVVSTKTGEVLGFKKEDVEVEGLKPVDVMAEIKKRTQPTYYDVTKLPEKHRETAEQYLRECEAREVKEHVWRAPIRLERMTQCIVEAPDDTEA